MERIKKLNQVFFIKFSVKFHLFTEKPILSKPEMIENLLSGISENLENFQNLSQIKFQYLQFSEIALENLSRVIKFFFRKLRIMGRESLKQLL